MKQVLLQSRSAQHAACCFGATTFQPAHKHNGELHTKGGKKASHTNEKSPAAAAHTTFITIKSGVHQKNGTQTERSRCMCAWATMSRSNLVLPL